MKKNEFVAGLSLGYEDFTQLARWLWRIHRGPVLVFLLMCFNLVVAPAVYAASAGSIDRTTAWAIGLLGIITLGLSIYLFSVIFQPEKF